MAQEFSINSSAIENKINQLLPSQGGFGAGVDFSASTMVIPIVDLTESAEGSSLRADLQTCFSKNTAHTSINNATTTIVTTTGYFRVFGVGTLSAGGSENVEIRINDGVTNYTIYKALNNTATSQNVSFDFIVLLKAGDSLVGVASATDVYLEVSTRQVADLSENLVNP